MMRLKSKKREHLIKFIHIWDGGTVVSTAASYPEGSWFESFFQPGLSVWMLDVIFFFFLIVE